MGGDIDFDCGAVFPGEAMLEDAGERRFALLPENGERQAGASEAHGFADVEFVPWSRARCCGG